MSRSEEEGYDEVVHKVGELDWHRTADKRATWNLEDLGRGKITGKHWLKRFRLRTGSTASSIMFIWYPMLWSLEAEQGCA